MIDSPDDTQTIDYILFVHLFFMKLYEVSFIPLLGNQAEKLHERSTVNCLSVGVSECNIKKSYSTLLCSQKVTFFK